MKPVCSIIQKSVVKLKIAQILIKNNQHQLPRIPLFPLLLKLRYTSPLKEITKPKAHFLAKAEAPHPSLEQFCTIKQNFPSLLEMSKLEIKGTKSIFTNRFIDAAIPKFLKNEMERLSQNISADQQPRRSSDKEPSKSALLLRTFLEGVSEVLEHIVDNFQTEDTCRLISKHLFDFFHMEDRMRPLTRLNEPYEVKQMLLKLFTLAFAWSSWQVGRGRRDSPDQQNLRKKLRLRITRIINALKIHEDIILIEVTDVRMNKFEGEILIPIVKKVTEKYLSFILLEFLEELCEECDLTETSKIIASIRLRSRELINSGPSFSTPQAINSRITPFVVCEKMEEEPALPILIQTVVKQEDDVKREEPSSITTQKIEYNPIRRSPAQDPIFRSEIQKKPVLASSVVGGTKDFRKEMFFEKFIKGCGGGNLGFGQVKKEAKEPNTFPRATYDNMQRRTTQKKKSTTKRVIDSFDHAADKGRKLALNQNQQLVYIKKKPISKVKQERRPKDNFLFNLKNNSQMLKADDISDYEFLPPANMLQSPDSKMTFGLPNSSEKKQRLYSGDQNLLTTNSNSKDQETYKKFSMAKFSDNEAPASNQKVFLRKSAAKKSVSKQNSSSKANLEVIDCESDNENSITFDDWSRNIVAFSTPAKEKGPGRNLTSHSQRILAFGQNIQFNPSPPKTNFFSQAKDNTKVTKFNQIPQQ